MSLVLHRRHKLAYFKNAGWEVEWVEAACQIVHNEFYRSYAPLPDVSDEEESEVQRQPTKVCLLWSCQVITTDIQTWTVHAVKVVEHFWYTPLPRCSKACWTTRRARLLSQYRSRTSWRCVGLVVRAPCNVSSPLVMMNTPALSMRIRPFPAHRWIYPLN